MPTDTANAKVTPAQVLADMARLSTRQLEKVIEQAAVLRLQKRRAVMSARESDLLRIINRGLSAAKNERLEELQDKLRTETINQREQAQLVHLSHELEKLGAERLKALMELAAIRRTTVAKLMEEMSLTEATHA